MAERIEQRLALCFRRAHVQEPLLCEMVRHCRNLLFNIHDLNVGPDQAHMTLSVVGKRAEIKEAERFLTTFDVDLRKISSDTFEGLLPEIPDRRVQAGRNDVPMERKLWLTFVGPLQQHPFLWVLLKRFDITFKIMQSVTGDPVSIVSLLIWGPRIEVEAAVTYLREQRVNVEYGEVGVSAPFDL